MAMGMHVPVTAQVPPDHARPKQDKQSGDQELGTRPERIGQSHAAEDDQKRDDADRRRVTQAPDQAQPGSAPELGPGPGGEGRNGRKMIRLKGMPETQQAPDGQNGYN